MIPEAAVEAAARADYGNGDQYGTWETEPEEVRAMYLNDARRVLEAAAPHMPTEAAGDSLRAAWDRGYSTGQDGMTGALAEAWESGHDACADEMAKYENPYGPTP